jgi:hypothetical protein
MNHNTIFNRATFKFTFAHFLALVRIKDRRDVWNYVDAKMLREVQQVYPQLLVIGESETRTTGVEQEPYFGAELTEKGRQFIDALELTP